MSYFDTYDSRKPLECVEFKQNNRQLGVLVSSRFTNMGRRDRPTCVEVSYERPSMNTSTFARLACPYNEWRAEAIDQTLTIIESINKVMAELSQHRDRLLAEIFDLQRFRWLQQSLIEKIVELNLEGR